nr:hypothetical protein [Tanacetum cinerariifolium]
MSPFVKISHTHQYVVPFHTKKLFTTLRVNSPSFSGRIVPPFDTMLVHQDELASPVRDVSEGEACPTDSGFIADQERATIAKSSTLPHDSAPRVTSPVADEGSMQYNIFVLTALCTSLQRQYSELQAKFQAQEEEIKKKLQEQIDAQVARELEEQKEKENMRMNEEITRDAEVARIHAEEELHGMIDSLDKSNETI